jgi:hypothetical protein
MAAASGVSTPTIKRLEAADGPLGGRDETVAKIRLALEGAGIEFTNGETPGVRMRRPRARLSAEELQSVIVGELKKHPHCAGVQRITIGRLDDSRTSATWYVSHANFGTNGQMMCEPILREIEARLIYEYDLDD